MSLGTVEAAGPEHVTKVPIRRGHESEVHGQDVLRAWSNWMPQVDMGLGATMVDPALSNASLGTLAATSV